MQCLYISLLVFSSKADERYSLKCAYINIHNTKRNLRISKGQTEILKSADRQDHDQQNETKDKHRTHNTTLKTKAGLTQTLQKPG